MANKKRSRSQGHRNKRPAAPSAQATVAAAVRPPAPVQTTRPSAPAQPARATASVPTARRGAIPQTPPVDFSVDYHYVLADLKRLGLVAAGLFALLVILSLFL
jgi:hypothetical protein